MSNFAPKRTTYDTGDNRWNRDGIRARAHGVSVTTASFKAADIAADGLVKSGSLVAGEGHEGEMYELAGPEALTLREGAAIMARSSRQTITYRNAPLPEVFASLPRDDVARRARHTALAEASYGTFSGLCVDAERLTGAPTMTLAEWLRARGRHHFLLTAPPLDLPGAIASPLMPVATV